MCRADSRLGIFGSWILVSIYGVLPFGRELGFCTSLADEQLPVVCAIVVALVVPRSISPCELEKTVLQQPSLPLWAFATSEDPYASATFAIQAQAVKKANPAWILRFGAKSALLSEQIRVIR